MWKDPTLHKGNFTTCFPENKEYTVRQESGDGGGSLKRNSGREPAPEKEGFPGVMRDLGYSHGRQGSSRGEKPALETTLP